MTLTNQYLNLTRDMCKKFYETYYWDSEEEYADLESDYLAYTDMVGSRSSRRPWTPRGPLLLEDGMVQWDIDDIWTALERQIPKPILLDFWRNHREDYEKETYRSVNLRHYYRKNYDPEVYQKEKEEELEKSRLDAIQSRKMFEEALGLEKGFLASTFPLGTKDNE